MTYLLICKGQHYSSVTLEEAAHILSDVGGYGYGYIRELADRVADDHDVIACANDLCEHVGEATKEIRQLSINMDEEFKQWLSSKKCGMEQKERIAAKSAERSSAKTNSEAGQRRKTPRGTTSTKS